ncbi:MAG: DNA-binding transcriptional regulator [Alphaproteobacteria bacterium]|nr:DNA-binding transcriptional regulator [Alphaproteobacteria bacterium]
MNKAYKSEAFAAIHEAAESLHSIGAMSKQTLNTFDDTCLTPIHPLTPSEIRAIRDREQVSQAVFAHYLNVSTSIVSKWERGDKTPMGSSLKLLSLVQHKGLEAVV